MNQEAPEEMAAGSRKWRGLARANELRRGDFKVVHKVGDRMTDGRFEPPAPVVTRALSRKLGLYWGCMDVDPALQRDDSANCDPWQDPRGAPFYRPMARCRMRYQAYKFCRVCADGIQTIIEQATK
jgi:hypothetical protein